MKRIKLLYIGDLIMEAEDRIFHGFFDIDKFVHEKCILYGVECVEKEILEIINKCKRYDKVQKG